jgi:hypothetical protein
MNYFQAYLPSLNEAIVAAWDSQLAEAAEAPWLAQALATKSADLFPRFADAYAQLRVLPRGARRALQRQLARSGEFAIPLEWQRKLAGSLAGAALLLALGQGTAQANDIFVDTNKPAILVDGKCSLIEAIENANDTVDGAVHTDCDAADPAGADVIILPANKTHTLTTRHNYYNLTYSGLPLITSDITIEGNGGKIARKASARTFRVVDVAPVGNLTLRNLTLRGGRADDDGGALFNLGTVTIENSTISGNSSADEGGGLFNADSGTMTVRNSKILENKASEDGGGINNEENSTLIIEDSTISRNTSGDDGGGIGSEYYGTITITNSIISKNKAAEDGGGIDIERYSTFTITNSTITGNIAADDGGGLHIEPYAQGSITDSTISKNKAADHGGGVHNDGDNTVTITNSTVSGNQANDSGGGIYNGYRSTLIIENSTISGNRSKFSYGGGINNDYQGTVTINNSTIASNKAGDDGGGIATNGVLNLNRSLISGNKAPNGREVYNYVDGTITAANFNIFGVSGNPGVASNPYAVQFAPGATDIEPSVALNKIIGPLKLNAPGASKTHALAENSPAIDIIPAVDCPATDQRGVARPQGAACDIGAFEKDVP